MAIKNNFMKSHFLTILITTVMLTSCFEHVKNQSSPNTSKKTEIYTGPIIDMHIHAFVEESPFYGMSHPPTLRGNTFEGVKSALEQKERTLEKFNEHKIVKAVVSNGHLWGEEDKEKILIGGSNRSIEELRNQYEEGMLDVIGEMAPFYAGKLADDPSQIPYFELAQELDIPVGFHVFPGGPNYGIHVLPKMLGGMRVYNANPLQLEDVLIKYPKLRLYIMHGGWPYVEDVKALMYAHPSLYVEIAVVNWILPQEELNSYLKSLITAGFGDRIMYGSDQMVWPEVITIGVESVNNADFLTLEQKEDIFFDNAAKFLRLSKEEISKYKSP